MGWFIGFGFLAILIGIPFWQENRRIAVDDQMRRKTKGTYKRLSRGVTHYRWVGPVRGPVAVMIHGLTTPMVALEQVAEGLGQTGYRVLMYDLYGRGLSDAPSGPQNEAFFVDQLTELLADQGVQDDITLVGYSMGGSIATAFAARNPHRIKQVVLLASAGIRTRESRFSRFCRLVPGVGDWLHGTLAAARLTKTLGLEPGTPADVIDAQRAEVRRKGFLQAVLASRRGLLAKSMEQEHRALGRDAVPVIAIWGKNDPVIPISALGDLARWNRTAVQDDIAGAGHGLPYTHADQIIAILRKYFRESAA